jgi:uncharacterized integral membrane protein
VGDESAAPGRVVLTSRLVIGLVGVSVVLALLLLFVADNFVLIEVRLLVIRVQARLAWVLIVTFIAGAGIGFLTARLWR